MTEDVKKELEQLAQRLRRAEQKQKNLEYLWRQIKKGARERDAATAVKPATRRKRKPDVQ